MLKLAAAAAPLQARPWYVRPEASYRPHSRRDQLIAVVWCCWPALVG